MENLSENKGDAFELNKDLGVTDQTSEHFTLENQLSFAKNIETPIHLKKKIVAEINAREISYWRSITMVAATIFLLILGGIILLTPFKQPSLKTQPIMPNAIQKNHDLATILEKELGVPTHKDQKYYALYFSSSLCKPCIELLNELDRFYVEQKAINPNFEIVFIEMDKRINLTKNQTELHLKKLEFNDLQNKMFFKKYKDKYGPSFVVLDGKGNIVTKHKKNTRQNSFNTVLTEFSNLLTKS